MLWWKRKPSQEEKEKQDLEAMRKSGVFKKAQEEQRSKMNAALNDLVEQLEKIYRPGKGMSVSYLGSKVYVTGVGGEYKEGNFLPIIHLAWFDGFKHVQNAEVKAASVDALKALVIPPAQVFGKHPEGCDPLEEGTAV